MQQHETTIHDSHRSKVDWWAVAILVFAWLLMLAIFARGLMEGEPLSIVLGGYTIVVYTIGMFLTVPMRYVLHEDRLVIHLGPVVRKSIPYSSMTRVEITQSIWTIQAAWSTDRITVQYGFSKIAISPIRKMAFAQKLAAAAGLVKEGDAWVRPGDAGA